MACNEDTQFELVAVKRKHCPELLFAMFKWVIPFQPFRWLFTTPVNNGQEQAKNPERHRV